MDVLFRNNIIIPVFIAVSFLAIFYIIIKFQYYRKIGVSEAVIRSGFGGKKILRGGYFFIPEFHHSLSLNMNTIKIPVSTKNRSQLITKDGLYIDIETEFFIRVGSDKKSIYLAGEKLGNKTYNAALLKEHVGGLCYYALRESVSMMQLSDIYQDHQQLSDRNYESLKSNISTLGLVFEGFAVIDFQKIVSGTIDRDDYIIINMPEEEKSLFQDVLRGFEEYSYVKGIKVSISVDPSIEGKIAFKFTLTSNDVDQVQRDLNEYIERIQKGDNFDDLFHLSNIEIQKVVLSLRNRIIFLQQNYQLERNMKEYYEKALNNLTPNSSRNHGISIQLNQGTIEMDNKTYTATNSANSIQGDKNKNRITSGEINIGSNQNERNDLIFRVNKLIEMIESESSLHKVVDDLESVKAELEKKKKPDKKLIFKWLTNIKTAFDSVEVAENIYTYATEIYKAFRL